MEYYRQQLLTNHSELQSKNILVIYKAEKTNTFYLDKECCSTVLWFVKRKKNDDILAPSTFQLTDSQTDW